MLRIGSRRIWCCFALLLGISDSVIAGPFEDGAAANKAGDYQKAIELWLPLAKRGQAKAQFAIGIMYKTGRGVPKDNLEATEWFTRSAEGGDMAAQFELGSDYGAGRGIAQNYILSAKWLRRAANQGDKLSQLMLGGIYAKGLGVQRDLIESLKWLIIAAQGNTMFHDKAVENGNIVSELMNSAEIVQAQKLAFQWRSKIERKVR